MWRAWVAGVPLGKTVTTFARLEDASGNSQEVQNFNFASTTYGGFSSAFNLPPDAGAWTQTQVDGLGAGLRSINTNTGNPNVSALAVELFTCGTDPPAVAADRRRLLGGVV